MTKPKTQQQQFHLHHDDDLSTITMLGMVMDRQMQPIRSIKSIAMLLDKVAQDWRCVKNIKCLLK